MKMLVVLNLNHGPWLSKQFLAQKAEALALFRQSLSPDSLAEFARDYAEDLAFEQGLAPGEEASVLFEKIFDMATFSSPGALVQLRRFFSWTVAFEKFDPQWSGAAAVHGFLRDLLGQARGNRLGQGWRNPGQGTSHGGNGHGGRERSRMSRLWDADRVAGTSRAGGGSRGGAVDQGGQGPWESGQRGPGESGAQGE